MSYRLSLSELYCILQELQFVNYHTQFRELRQSCLFIFCIVQYNLDCFGAANLDHGQNSLDTRVFKT